MSATTWSISTCGRRGLTGTYTPPASQMAAIVHTRSGPFGSITATAWPGSIGSCGTSSATRARASPAVIDSSMVKRSPSSSAKG